MFKVEGFPVDEGESFAEKSICSLRLSRVRRALVWACCSVWDEDYMRVNKKEKGFLELWFHLLQATARHRSATSDLERERGMDWSNHVFKQCLIRLRHFQFLETGRWVVSYHPLVLSLLPPPGQFPSLHPSPTTSNRNPQKMGFLSGLCCVSSKHTTDPDDEKRPRPRNKPPRYNRHNLPSIVVEDPAPWVVKKHDKLELLSDGMIVIGPPSQRS